MTFALIRSKGRIIGDGLLISPKDLRNGIPTAALLSLQIDAALSGCLRVLDSQTGEEVAPAIPISVQDRLKLIDTLVGKRLPAAKVQEADDDAVNLDDAPVSTEDIKRLPLSELGRILEASFKVVPTRQEQEP